ncbi:MAG TPA: diguanylate cyclase, partial [Steroidobacteraceae bacterium]|nr:diguanylate cyclase [Steroidobacteraceae bacterium]
ADLERRVAERTAELDTARRSLQGVLDAATQIAIIATDADRLITVFNSGAERMLGYSAAEMVGKKTSPALHLETELIEHARTLKVRFGRTNPGFDRLVENARHGKSEEREWTYVRKDGSHLTVNLALTALRDAKGEPNGYLNVASDITERKRSEAELERVRAELVQGLADATTANDALKLQTELLRRLNEERAALANLSELLAACASPEEAYAIFGGAAIGLFPSLAGVLHMYGPAQDQLMPVAAWGEWPVAALPVGAKECWALRRGRFYIGTGTTTPACGHAGPAQELATLCVPLMADGEVLGVLQLRGPDAAMLQSSLQPASTAGDGLALTLANLRLRETLKEQSIRDPLTELFNRRYLTETLAREFARARRAGAPMAVIMLDVDHFKRFNDRFGHSAGDVVLREFGAFLKRSIRSDDLACRYGGEEFCLILPQTGRDGAQQRAESIRAGAARLVLNSEGCALEPITLSLGVALFPEDGDSAESLMRAADGALYQAKREGRNRVVMSQAAAVADDTAALDAPAA